VGGGAESQHAQRRHAILSASKKKTQCRQIPDFAHLCQHPGQRGGVVSFVHSKPQLSGKPDPPGEVVWQTHASLNFFHTMGLPILRGRDFSVIGGAVRRGCVELAPCYLLRTAVYSASLLPFVRWD
jgi:hypothetical protein